MSRSRAAMLNWFIAILNTVITMCVGLLATPLIYEPLGKERFGVIRTLTEVFAYITLVAQGLSVALVPLLAGSVNRGDTTVAKRIVAAALRCYGLVIGVVVVVGVAALPAIGWAIPVPAKLLPELRLAWLINLAGLPMMLMLPAKILIEIDQKGYVVSVALLVQSLVTTILSVILVRSGWGINGVMLATLIGTACFSLIMFVIWRQYYRHLYTGVLRMKTTREDWRSITTLSWPTFLAMLSQRVGMLSDSIVLTRMIDPAAATVLYLNQRLASLVEMVLRTIGGAIWPGLAELHAREEHALFNRRLEELTRIVVVLGVAALVPVVLLNSAFVTRWITDPTLHKSTPIAFVAAVNALLLTISMIWSVPLVSTGQVKLIARPAMIGAALNLAASVLFTHWLGPIGPLLGTTIALSAIDLWYFPLLLHRSFDVTRRSLYRAVIVPLFWAVPYAGAVWFVVDWAPPTGLILILGTIAVSASLFLAFSYWAILSAEERGLWQGRVFAPLRRRLGDRLGADRPVTVSSDAD